MTVPLFLVNDPKQTALQGTSLLLINNILFIFYLKKTADTPSTNSDFIYSMGLALL